MKQQVARPDLSKPLSWSWSFAIRLKSLGFQGNQMEQQQI